jgi:hypothetical protein
MNQKREKFDQKAADKILQRNQKISSSKLHCSTTSKQKKEGNISQQHWQQIDHILRHQKSNSILI